MKKLLIFLLLLAISLTSIVSCSGSTAKIKIGVMNGPTGMGMAKLMNDAGEDSEKYSFTSFSSPADATTALANGELDMLCVPTNLAANLAKGKEDYIQVAAINTLGSLYVVTKDGVTVNSINDLQGKTVYYGEPTSTTGPILNYILAQNGIEANLEALATNELVGEKVAAGEASIVVLPEPKATVSINTAKKGGNNYSVALNLSTEWSKVSDRPLTMGCIIVKKDFAKENKKALDKFLAEYELSIAYVNNKDNLDSASEMIVNAGILPNAVVAKSALGNLYGSIVYIDGDGMKDALESFYTAIGLTLPDDSFYYEK